MLDVLPTDLSVRCKADFEPSESFLWSSPEAVWRRECGATRDAHGTPPEAPYAISNVSSLPGAICSSKSLIIATT